MIMKSEWERIEMNGNVIGCDIGVGFDTISAIQHWKENKQTNEWMNEKSYKHRFELSAYCDYVYFVP